MKHLRAWLSVLVICLFPAGYARCEENPLTIGIIPYLTPNLLMDLFKPVREHLQEQLGRPVDLYTAPDVRTFVQRTLVRKFDVVITAAHQARLAEVKAGYIPVVRFTGPLNAAVVTGIRSPIRTLSDLRGHMIAVTDRSILVNIAMTKILADHGVGDDNVQFVPVNTQNTGLLAVAGGDVDAAIVALFTLDQSPAVQRDAVRLLFKSDDLPNVTILLNPNLPATDRDRIKANLLDLPGTSDGANFLKASRFQGIAACDETFMTRLDVFLPETLRQLGL
jgi:phosphonate transport system substrate-binding protein